MISKLSHKKLRFAFRFEDNSNCKARQKGGLVLLMLLKFVQFLKLPATKTC